jgi:hypothetical protein
MTWMNANSFGPPPHSNLIYCGTASSSIAAGGTYILNLEESSGLYTTGLLYVRGNENGVNQTIKVYSWTLAYYSPTNTREVRMSLIESNVLNNGYGDVYAYIPAYSSNRTASIQTASSTSTSVTDIYLRNAVGYGCTAQWSLWRTG